MFVDFQFNTLKIQVWYYLNAMENQFFSFPLLIFIPLDLAWRNMVCWYEWGIVVVKNQTYSVLLLDIRNSNPKRWWRLYQFSIARRNNKEKKKQETRAIQTKNSHKGKCPKEPMRTECEIANCLKRAKSVNNQVMTCLSSAFDWLRERHQFSEPITERWNGWKRPQA